MRQSLMLASLMYLLACGGSGRVTVRPQTIVGVVPRVNLQVQAQATPGASVHVEGQAQVQAQADAQAQANLEAQAALRAQAEAEARSHVAVPIHGAGTVEFFGIPLEGARDVVFVLDRSGSMAERAHERLVLGAPIAATPPTPAEPATPPTSPTDTSTASEPTPATANDADGATTTSAVADDAAATPAPSALDPSIGYVALQPSKLDVAQQELIEALQGLADGTTLNLIFFADALDGFAPQMFVLEGTARDGMVAFVRSAVAWGSTALAPAMRTAFLMNPRRVVLLSDGLGNVGGDSNDVLRDAREAMLGGTRIDTIGLGPDQDSSLLRTLATESGGLYQDLR